MKCTQNEECENVFESDSLGCFLSTCLCKDGNFLSYCKLPKGENNFTINNKIFNMLFFRKPPMSTRRLLFLPTLLHHTNFRYDTCMVY